MNKKKIIIISVLIIIVLVGIYLLYNTFAISSYVSDNSDTYTINLTNGNNTINVPSKSSKIVYYKINNTNNGTVKYGIGYNSSNIIVKVYEDSKDPVTGLVSSKDNKFVKLKLINNSTNNDTVTLSTIFGYENGGDLIVPSGVTLVTQKIKKVNTIKNAESNVSATSNFLGTTLVRNTIESITITNDNIVPTNAIGSFDVSNSNDGSIMLWYTKGSSDNLYNVYIGSESGKVYAPTDCYYLFACLTNAIKIDFSYFNTSNATRMPYMFRDCSNLTTLTLGSEFKTDNNTTMYRMFSGLSKLTTLDVSGFNTSNVTNMSLMFYDCSSLTSLDVSKFDTSKVTDMNSMFYNCASLNSIDVSSFITSKVTNMAYMFYNMSSIEELKLNNFNTGNVTNMKHMFEGVSKVTSLDLSNFTTSKVTEMASMFSNMTVLTSLDISSFNTENVTRMDGMFYNAASLTTLNLSNFLTPKVTTTENMFCGMTALTNLNLENFTFDKVTTVRNMFAKSKNITYLDLRSADFSNVTSYSNMFPYFLSDITIIVKNDANKTWIEDKISNGTVKLVGEL